MKESTAKSGDTGDGREGGRAIADKRRRAGAMSPLEKTREIAAKVGRAR